MTPVCAFLADGTLSARETVAAVSAFHDWTVVDISNVSVPDTPTAAVERLIPSGVQVAIVPFAVVSALASASDELPAHVSWIAYGPSEDILRAFFIGAADYLVEGWAPLEAIGRARRTIGVSDGQVYGSILVDGDQTIVLRGVELLLWSALRQNTGRVVERAVLAEIIRPERGGAARSRRVDMAISRLRKRLGPHGARIETVRGRGYRLRDE